MAPENKKPGCRKPGQVLDLIGADSLTRTDDLPLTRRLLYQLSYAGEARIIAYSRSAFEQSATVHYLDLFDDGGLDVTRFEASG